MPGDHGPHIPSMRIWGWWGDNRSSTLKRMSLAQLSTGLGLLGERSVSDYVGILGTPAMENQEE